MESCVVPADEVGTAGDPPTAKITAYAASTLVDINGCVDDTVGDCHVRPGEEAVVYFGKEPNEIDSLFTKLSFTNGAIVPGPDMDLVLGSETTVTRLGLDGQVRWDLPQRADDIKITPSGDIYVRAFGGIVRVDGDGNVRWTHPGNAVAFDLFANGDVAVVDGSQLEVIAAADGMQRWTVPVSAATVAVHHNGTIAVSAVDAIIKRFDPTGTPLADWTLPAAGFTELAVEANDRLFAQIVQPSVRSGLNGVFYPRHTVRFADDGTVAGLASNDVSDYGYGFAVGAGDLEWLRAVQSWHTTPVPGGTAISANSEDGAQAWQLLKQTAGYIGSGSMSLGSEFIAFDAACNGGDACAVFGQFRSGSATINWLQVFRLPSS